VKRRIDRWLGGPRYISAPIRSNGGSLLQKSGQSFFDRFDLGGVLMRLRGPERGSHRRFPLFPWQQEGIIV